MYIRVYTHFLFCFPAHLSKNSDPPWIEKLGCVCLKPNISLFGLKVCCVKVQTASMLPGFFESPWQSKVFSPQSQVELHLWGNLRYQKKSSRIQIIRYQKEHVASQVFKRIHWNTWANYHNSKTWVNGIFGGDSLTITTKFGVTSAEIPLKFAQIIDLKKLDRCPFQAGWLQSLKPPSLAVTVVTSSSSSACCRICLAPFRQGDELFSLFSSGKVW